MDPEPPDQPPLQSEEEMDDPREEESLSPREYFSSPCYLHEFDIAAPINGAE